MGISTVLKDYGTDILNAIRENDLAALKAILEKHLRSNSKIARLCISDIKHRPTKKFACPLILAARSEDSRIIRYMMEKGTDPNFVHHTIFSTKRKEEVTALHIAVDMGLYDTVEILLAANADPNIPDHKKETPLHIATKKADQVMTRMLLSHGGNPSVTDHRDNAVLHIATTYGHLQLVRIMLKYDADVYQKGQFGAIPPHIAAKEGHIHLIQLFCSRDVGNVNIKIPCYDGREKAPIHLAAENGHIETVRSLLTQFDAEVNLKDSDGNTPLHCTVLNPYDAHRMRDKDSFTETARSLVRGHVAINEKNVFGDTALHLAAMNHFQRIVELLLEVGANPFVENEEGLKPIDVVPDSDPVTKNVLKMAMLNPRRPIKNLSVDTLERTDNQNTMDMNRHHVMMADGVVESLSSHSTPENALDTSISVKSSISHASSYPSVFDENADRQGLGRVPVGAKSSKDKARKDQPTDPRDPRSEGAQHGDHILDSDRSHSQSSSRHKDRSHRKKEQLPADDVPPELPARQRPNEISQHSLERRDKQKKEEEKSKRDKQKKEEDKNRRPTGNNYNDDTISFTSQSTYATDDASSMFSTGAGNSNALVQREIQKLFSKQQVVRKKQKRRDESFTSDTASYMDDPQPQDSFEQSVSTLDEERKKKKKKSRDKDKENQYKDDKVIYENIPDPDETAESWASESTAVTESVASEQSDRRKKKSKSKSKLDSVLATAKQSKKDVVPYDSQGKPLQPGSVKVNSVPGRPGTIEVQYSGGPITICVDTSAVDQQADGRYYFTDQYGRQFPVDLQNPQDLMHLQQLQQGQAIQPPARPPKGEPIYANTTELFGTQKPPMASPNKGYQDTSGFTNGSASIRELDDSQDDTSEMTYEYDEEEEEELEEEPEEFGVDEDESINAVIKSKVQEATRTPKPKPASRSTPTKQFEKAKPVKKPRTSLASEAEEKSKSKRPAEPMVVTRAVSLNEDNDSIPSTDDSPNVSPQYKSFAQKLLWAKGGSGDQAVAQPTQSRPPIEFGRPEELGPREEDEDAQETDSDEDSSSHSEDESVIASPFKKAEDARKALSKSQEEAEHAQMYSLTPNIDVEGSESDSESESSDGESSVVHKPNAGPRPIKIREPTKKTLETVTARETKVDNVTRRTLDMVHARETKFENVTRVEVMEVTEKSEKKRKPKVRPRRTKSPEEEFEPLPSADDEQIEAEKKMLEVVLAEELPEQQVWDKYENEPGRGRQHHPKGSSLSSLEVSTTLSERSQSVDSIASDYSEGGTRRLNMHVTGEVPKAYTRGQKDSARRNFLAPGVLEWVESGSETSDSEFGSRGSLSERTMSPMSAERSKRWSEEAKPITAKSPEGLVPRDSPSQQRIISPIPPEQTKPGKPHMIGSYARPYKSFGKIETKTDAIDEALLSSPLLMYSSNSPRPNLYSPAQTQKEKLPTFPSSEIKITPSRPAIERADIIKPQAITAQNAEMTIYPSVPNESKTDFNPEEAHGLKILPPQESKAQVGQATTAFKKNIKVMETGPETLTSEQAKQLLEGKAHIDKAEVTAEEAQSLETTDPLSTKAEAKVTKSSFKKNIKVLEDGPQTLTSEQARQEEVGKKRKTVSLTEERVTSGGQTVKTITTTVTPMKTAKSMSVSSVFLDKSSSDTETSSSEDDTSSDSSQSQEEYETERGLVQKQRSGSMDMLTQPESSKPAFNRSISGKKPRPQLIKSQISQDDKSKSLPPEQIFLISEIKKDVDQIKTDKESKKLEIHEQIRQNAEESHKQLQKVGPIVKPKSAAHHDTLPPPPPTNNDQIKIDEQSKNPLDIHDQIRQSAEESHKQQHKVGPIVKAKPTSKTVETAHQEALKLKASESSKLASACVLATLPLPPPSNNDQIKTHEKSKTPLDSHDQIRQNAEQAHKQQQDGQLEKPVLSQKQRPITKPKPPHKTGETAHPESWKLKPSELAASGASDTPPLPPPPYTSDKSKESIDDDDLPPPPPPTSAETELRRFSTELPLPPLPTSEPPSSRPQSMGQDEDTWPDLPAIEETNLDDDPKQPGIGSSSSLRPPRDVQFEQYEDEPGARRPRPRPVDQKPQPVEQPVPSNRSSIGSAPVQIVETNLDDVLQAAPVPIYTQGQTAPVATYTKGQNVSREQLPSQTVGGNNSNQSRKAEEQAQAQPLQMPVRRTSHEPTDPQATQNKPKKARVQGRRQIGQPRRGETIIQQEDKNKPEAAASGNTSFGPEDQEVANITSAAKNRKVAHKQKKHEWAIQQKSTEEQEKLRAEEEFEQAMLAAQAQHGKAAVPIQPIKHTSSSSSSSSSSNKSAQVLNPIPGVEISVSGGNYPVVSGPEKREPMPLPSEPSSHSHTMPAVSKENPAAETIKSFLKFPSKRIKKSKDKSGETPAEGDEKPKKKKKKKPKDDLNESTASLQSPSTEGNIYETIPDTPGKTTTTRRVEPDSPQSPEGQGIEQTVMGARVERDDTVKQRPSDVDKGRGLGFKLPVKRERRESSDDGYDQIPFDEANEITPQQSGLSQTQILANMMKENQKKGSRQTAIDSNLGVEEKTDLAPQGQPQGQRQGQQYPGQPQHGQQYSGQPQHGQQYPGQPQGQRYPGQPQHGQPQRQPYPGQPQHGQQYPGQPQHGQQYPGQPQHGQQYPGQQYPTQPHHGQQYPGQPQHGQQYPGQPQHGQQQPHQGKDPRQTQPHSRPAPKETCIDDDLPIHVTPKETNIDDDLDIPVKVPDVTRNNLKNQAHYPPSTQQETNLDDDIPVQDGPEPPPQGFSRTQSGRKSYGRGKKRGERGALPKPPAPPADSPSTPTDSNANIKHHHQELNSDPQRNKSSSGTILPPDPNQLSKLWSSAQQQEDDMMKMLQGMEDNMYEQPVCHREHGAGAGGPGGQHHHQAPQGPQGSQPSGSTRPSSMPSSQNRPPVPPNVSFRPPLSRPDDPYGRPSHVEVVDMQPPMHQAPPPPTHRGPGLKSGTRSMSNLGTASDSEAPSGPHRNRRVRGRRARQRPDGHHSDAEMNEFEAPLPPSPGISLQEAALSTITAGLKDQPKLTPMRNLLPESERQVNYTRGVYRPKPMTWKGGSSTRSSMGSLSSSRYDDSRYDDSSLVSQMWVEKHPRSAHTESEGEADNEGYYDDQQYAQGQYPGQQYPHPGQQQYPIPGQHPQQQYPAPGHPQNLPPHGPPGGNNNQEPVRRRPKKKRRPIPEPGPVDFSEYGPTAKLWMEHVDKKTVQKSDTMFLQVMPKGVTPSKDIQNAFRMSSTSMGDDDVFLPPQYVVARGRRLRHKKRALDQQQGRTHSSGGSDSEGEFGDANERQMLLFFRVGHNWQDLAWVLFDAIHSDAETIRMIKDIEIKHPKDLSNQVHDLMNRWWKKRGHDASIEELRRSLDMCHIPYLMEEINNRQSALFSHSESEDNLDTSVLSEQDPDVSRLLHEYQVRSLNASYEGGALSDSGDPRRSFNLSADNLARRLKEKGVTINRSKLGSSRTSSLGRSQTGSYLDSSHDESVDYYSDSESRRSFVIVQPQLKGGDYRHETNI